MDIRSKDDIKKAVVLLVMFSMLLAFKFQADLPFNGTSNLLNLVFLLFIATVLIYYATITKDKFMRFLYLFAILPLVLELPWFQFLGIQFVTMCSIIVILILLSCLLRHVMGFIENN